MVTVAYDWSSPHHFVIVAYDWSAPHHFVTVTSDWSAPHHHPGGVSGRKDHLGEEAYGQSTPKARAIADATWQGATSKKRASAQITGRKETSAVRLSASCVYTHGFGCLFKSSLRRIGRTDNEVLVTSGYVVSKITQIGWPNISLTMNKII